MSQQQLSEALNALNAGSLPEAQQRLQAILELEPEQADAQYYSGVVAFQQSDLSRAMHYIETAIRLQPGLGKYHYGKAVTLQALEKTEQAIVSYRQALTLQPDLADAQFNLAVLLQQQNKLDEAAEHYQALLKRNPTHKIILRNLGYLFAAQGRTNQAIQYYRQALAADPAYAEVYNNLGVQLMEQGCVDEAIATYRQGIQVQPDMPQLHNNLGNALKSLGQMEESLACYQEAIRLKPDYASPYRNLGILWRERKQMEQAEICFRKAIELTPSAVEAWVDLGDLLLMRNLANEALTCYEQAIRIEPRPAVLVKQARALPRIYQSTQEVAQWRTRFSEQFQALSRQPLQFHDPVSEIGAANFYLAYQGQDNRALQAQIGELFQKAHPWKQMAYVRNAKPRIGFFSTCFKPGHTITKFYTGLLEQLSREHFEVFIYTHRLKQPLGIQREHHIRNFNTDKLSPICETITQDQLDVLFYPDIGMEPISYFLAFNRLAPVQCVSWGHPDTTGIPTVDYFISSKLLEPENAQALYTETLVQLDSMPTCYQRPQLSGNALSRDAFGLSNQEHLYLCPQTLFKFHPEFDALLSGILRTDPQGRLVLVNSHLPEWGEMLLNRFQRTMPDVMNRITLLPALSHSEFLNLLNVADVVLDTLHFGGGNTSYETLAVGTPIVTWPQSSMKSRVTLGCYRKMNLTDGIVASSEEYIAQAVQFGINADYRQTVKEKILKHNHVLFEDLDAVRELERFFLNAIDQAALRP